MQEITKIRLEVVENFGSNFWKKFRDSYRFAKERCCNKNCKDFDRYNGKWGFKGTVEYYNTCFNESLIGAEMFGLKNLSIDRIDSNKKYEPCNIRFVSMKENLRNKDYVNDVIIKNIFTGEIVKFPSFFSISKEKLDTRFSTTGVWSAFKNKRMYKKYWKIIILD